MSTVHWVGSYTSRGSLQSLSLPEALGEMQTGT